MDGSEEMIMTVKHKAREVLMVEEEGKPQVLELTTFLRGSKVLGESVWSKESCIKSGEIVWGERVTRK